MARTAAAYESLAHDTVAAFARMTCGAAAVPGTSLTPIDVKDDGFRHIVGATGT